MSRATGRHLDGDAHLAQSIADILTTPIGTRVMRRDYGSALPELADQPMNAAGRLRLFAATASALLRWEPRIRVQRLALDVSASGSATLTVHALRLDVSNAARALTVRLTRQPGGSFQGA